MGVTAAVGLLVAALSLPPQEPPPFDFQFVQDAKVVNATLSPDGGVLVVLDEDGTLYGWRRQPRKRLYTRRILKRGDTSRRLTCSPDGRYLAISSRELPSSLLLVVGLADGKEVHRFDRGFSPAFSPDGEFLACSDGKRIRRWAMKSGAELPDLDKSPFDLKWVAWSPGGRQIAASAQFNEAVLYWDVPTRRVDLPDATGDGASVASLAFSPDGTMLAVGTHWGASIRVLSIEKHPVERFFEEYARGELSFSADARQLLCSDRRRHVSVWDRATGNRIFLWHSPFAREGIVDIACGGHFLIWIEGGGVRLERIPAFLGAETPRNYVTRVGFTADGRAVTGEWGGIVRYWDPETERELQRYELPDLKPIQFANQFQWAVRGEGAEGLVIRDIVSGKVLLKVEGLPFIQAIAFPPDHRSVGLGLKDGSVSIWDIRERRERSRVRMDGGAVFSLTWSSDGKTLAWGNAAGEVVFSEGERGGEQLVFAPRGDCVKKVEFLEDGKRLRMIDARGSSWVYVGELGQEPRPGRPRRVDEVLMPDDRWLNSAFMRQDCFVKAFSPDARYAIGTNGRGSAMIWRAPWLR